MDRRSFESPPIDHQIDAVTRGDDLAFSSRECTEFGATRRIRHTIRFSDGQTVQLSSAGRRHQLTFKVLGRATTDGYNETFLHSKQTEGLQTCQTVDATVVVKGWLVHVHSWGKSHLVVLR